MKMDSQYQKNSLYRDHYRMALGGTIFLAILCVCLSAMFVMMTLTQPQPKYYATTTTGEVIPLQSLSEPVVTHTYLLQWASLAARAAYNLDFVNYKSQLQAVNPYFTPDGFQKLQTAFNSSGLLDTLIQKKLIMTAIVSGDPVIIQDFVLYGRHNWVIQLPLLVSFESASEHRRVHVMVTMRVERVPVLDSEKGIQISDFLVG